MVGICLTASQCKAILSLAAGGAGTVEPRAIFRPSLAPSLPPLQTRPGAFRTEYTPAECLRPLLVPRSGDRVSACQQARRSRRGLAGELRRPIPCQSPSRDYSICVSAKQVRCPVRKELNTLGQLTFWPIPWPNPSGKAASVCLSELMMINLFTGNQIGRVRVG